MTSNASSAILRTYKAGELPELLYDECTIWEACRATSAATTFFDPIVIGSYGQRFVDGATGYNNPIQMVYDEARDIWHDRVDNAIMISVGTGSAPVGDFKGNLMQIAKTMRRLATDTQKSHNDFWGSHVDMDKRGLLYRFNVTQGLGDVGLQEHKEINTIADATYTYLRDDGTRKRVTLCTDKLHMSTMDEEEYDEGGGSGGGGGGGEDPTVEVLPQRGDQQQQSPRGSTLADFFRAMNEGTALLRGASSSGSLAAHDAAEAHLSRALRVLHELDAAPAHHVRAYTALMHLELGRTYLRHDSPGHGHGAAAAAAAGGGNAAAAAATVRQHLQTAQRYNDEARKYARRSETRAAHEAQARVQAAVLLAREARLAAKAAAAAAAATATAAANSSSSLGPRRAGSRGDGVAAAATTAHQQQQQQQQRQRQAEEQRLRREQLRRAGEAAAREIDAALVELAPWHEAVDVSGITTWAENARESLRGL